MAPAQSPSDYLDVMIVKVKPEKRADFDQILRKIADSNRKNKGDRWLTGETTYGEQNTIYFVSTRKSYDEIEKSYDVFMAAMTKAMGQTAAMKLLQDFNSCTLGTRAEVRRRRWDLSVNAPADATGQARLVAESRWYRTTTVRVRPGHVGAYEALLKEIKEAREKKSSQVITLVSQAAAGQIGNVFYLTSLQKSLAGFDQPAATIRELLGEEGFQRYQKVSQEAVLGTETVINRWVPEMSNPLDEYVSVSPDFWRPKPPAPAAKPKPEEPAKKP
jgi:quinol monooxygenase YgiN